MNQKMNQKNLFLHQDLLIQFSLFLSPYKHLTIPTHQKDLLSRMDAQAECHGSGVRFYVPRRRGKALVSLMITHIGTEERKSKDSKRTSVWLDELL